MISAQPVVRFGVININHGHIFGQVDAMLRSGAEFVSFCAPEPELVKPFAEHYPQASRVSTPEAILEDRSIQLIITSGIPAERAPLGLQARNHG